MSLDVSWVKHFHMLCATLTLTLFLGRGALVVCNVPLKGRRWARVLPDAIDTLLLASGVVLAMGLHQYPFADAWLTAKLSAIVVYIVLGFIAFRFGPSRGVRTVAWLMALGVFGYIVLVAFTRHPMPFA